jgi:hypothetical protein
MAVLDIQRRSQQIGRIRIGHQVRAASGKMRPERLTTFRFTTPSGRTAVAIAKLYGGVCQPWAGHEGQFEVITSRDEIGVMVPPRNAVVSQWYELWGKTIKRRCDSRNEQLSGGECLCPHAENPDDPGEVTRCALERAGLARMNPAQACSLVTRINVMIPDLPGLGVFRLDTGSFHAAGESGDKADVMELARERNVFLPASLRIEWRVRTTDAKPYPVPVLEILHTFRDIASGALEAGGIMAQLPPAPGEAPRAIAGPAPAAVAAGPAAAEAPAGNPGNAGDPEHGDAAFLGAQRIADAAASVVTQAGIEALAADARRLGVLDQHVCTGPDRDNDPWEQLRLYLGHLWKQLARAGRAS